MTNRREGEITHEHLDALGDRFERQIDRVERALSASMDDVKRTVLRQNGRIGKSEDAIGGLRLALAELHSAVALMKASGVSMQTAVPVATAAQKAVSEVSIKKFVAGLFALLVAMAGFFEVAKALGDQALKWLQP